MGKFLKTAIGLALIITGTAAIYLWWGDVLALIRGGSGCGLIFLGLIFLALLD